MKNFLENKIAELIPEPLVYNTPISEYDISALEEKTLSLPEDYRDFLLKTNGGYTTSYFVWTRDSNSVWNRESPNFFLGLKTKQGDEVHFGEGPTAGYLAIARDSGDNYLYLHLNKNDSTHPYGALYFLEHENSCDAVFFSYIAPSFSAYLELVNFYDEEEYFNFFKKGLDDLFINDDAEGIEEIILEKKWRLDEHYTYGNTLADQALLENKKNIFKKLVAMGAKVPRFFLYAHNTLSEKETVAYIQSLELK